MGHAGGVSKDSTIAIATPTSMSKAKTKTNISLVPLRVLPQNRKHQPARHPSPPLIPSTDTHPFHSHPSPPLTSIPAEVDAIFADSPGKKWARQRVRKRRPLQRVRPILLFGFESGVPSRGAAFFRTLKFRFGRTFLTLLCGSGGAEKASPLEGPPHA